eukprot:8988033-Heterocapsa_arctica.AAC.1
MADLPTGFTVCIRCFSPFIFVDVNADANQRVSGVSNAVPAAPAISSGGAAASNMDTTSDDPAP